MLEETGGSGNCLLVTNAHLTWDPEFKVLPPFCEGYGLGSIGHFDVNWVVTQCLLGSIVSARYTPSQDVKVMQTVMLLNEIEITVDEHMKSGGSRSVHT